MKLPNGVKIIIDQLDRHGHRADVVGGCVRDHLLGKAPYDYDITTDATPDEMLDIFRDFRTIPTGIKHGTLTVMADGEPHEVTTYRRDGDYCDHRHPDTVTFTEKIADDLSRRDFTVNAMAYNQKDGIADLFGGREDLKAGIIRAVGDPYRRFDEDALRILRAVRFSSTLGFKIEEGTATAARELSHLLSFVSGERIYTEWLKLISGKDAYRVLRDHRTVIESALGIKDYILPNEARFNTADKYTRFFSLFAGYNDPSEIYSSVCDRLRVDNAWRGAGVTVLSNLHRPLDSEVNIRLCLHSINKEQTMMLAATKELLGISDAHTYERVTEVIRSEKPFSTQHLAVRGGDVTALGFRGAAVGNVLEFLITSVIKGDLKNERDELINAAKGYTPHNQIAKM